MMWLVVLHMHGQNSCVAADAGPDRVVCTGGCAYLYPGIQGTKGTSIYSQAVIPYAPDPFTGGNPVLVNLDDVFSPAINIPFCFEFYGAVYNQLIIGTNGIVSFDVSQASGNCAWTINSSAPDPGLPMNCIMAPFHDIDPTIPTDSGATSINWNVYGTAPCRRFVVNWNDVALFGNGCDTLVSTSQVVLYETTNIIEIFLKEKPICTSWNGGAAIEGLHNANGTQAMIVPNRNFPLQWATAMDGVRFSPAGPWTGTFQWLDAAGNFIGNTIPIQVCPTQTTTYILEIFNSSCSGQQVARDSVDIVVVQSNLSIIDSVIQPTCPGANDGEIWLMPVNGYPPYTYVWTPNVSTGPSAQNLWDGLYTCNVTDSAGCTITFQVTLISPIIFTPIISTTSSVCGDSTGTASVTIIGGTAPFSYHWSNGDTTATVDSLSSGTYVVVITDSMGCPDTSQVMISASGLSITAQSTQLLCNGDCNASIALSVAGGYPPYSYQWTPYGGTAATASNLCSGLFFCTISDTNGCFTMFMDTIVNPPPIIISPNSNLTICLGESTSINGTATGGTPPYNYGWSNNLPNVPVVTVSPAQTTIYSLTVTDANGCNSATESILVKVEDVPQAGFSSSPASCPPVTISFTNLTDTAVSYYWNFGDPASGVLDTSTAFSPSHSYTTGGNYTVTLIAVNAYGCADTLVMPAAVVVPVAPVADLTADAQLLTTLDPGTAFHNLTQYGVSFLIYFGDGDSLLTTDPGPYSHTYDSVGVYEVVLIAWSASGCPDTTSLTLILEEATTCFVPNAFTPNGDGANDEFMVYGINMTDFRLMIFDRWGMLIFSTEDPAHGWNGTLNGNPVQEDVFVWKLIYTDNSGREKKKAGHVSLVR
jgi:gliding motility-associated-like protein